MMEVRYSKRAKRGTAREAVVTAVTDEDIVLDEQGRLKVRTTAGKTLRLDPVYVLEIRESGGTGGFL